MWQFNVDIRIRSQQGNIITLRSFFLRWLQVSTGQHSSNDLWPLAASSRSPRRIAELCGLCMRSCCFALPLLFVRLSVCLSVCHIVYSSLKRCSVRRCPRSLWAVNAEPTASESFTKYASRDPMKRRRSFVSHFTKKNTHEMIEKTNKKLCCRKEVARCFVSVSS